MGSMVERPHARALCTGQGTVAMMVTAMGCLARCKEGTKRDIHQRTLRLERPNCPGRALWATATGDSACEGVGKDVCGRRGSSRRRLFQGAREGRGCATGSEGRRGRRVYRGAAADEVGRVSQSRDRASRLRLAGWLAPLPVTDRGCARVVGAWHGACWRAGSGSASDAPHLTWPWTRPRIRTSTSTSTHARIHASTHPPTTHPHTQSRTRALTAEAHRSEASRRRGAPKPGGWGSAREPP
jgi:hypothetical protein